MLVELTKLIQASPLFTEKLGFLISKGSRLLILISQSINFATIHTPTPISRLLLLIIVTEVKLLPARSSLGSPVPKACVFLTIGAHGLSVAIPFWLYRCCIETSWLAFYNLRL